MKATLLLLALLCSSLLNHAQHTVKLDNRATVVFPEKTGEMQSETGPITFSPLDKDNKITGMATVIDVAQFGVDSAMIAANYDNATFVDLILQSLLGQYPGVAVVSKKKITKGTQKGYELALQKDKPDEAVPYKNLYAQLFFVGTNVYALTVLTMEGVDATADKEKFFTSLKIN